MPEKPSHDELLDKCAEQYPAYPRAAYQFVCQAVHKIARAPAKQQGRRPRHITGQELCIGLSAMLLDEFDRMAIDVLNAWNITETNDFGNIVYALVDVGALFVSPNDSRTDFTDVYRFHDIFVKPFQPQKNNIPFPEITFL